LNKLWSICTADDLRIGDMGASGWLRSGAVIWVTGPVGTEPRPVPIEGVVKVGDRLQIHGSANDFFAQATLTRRAGDACEYYEVDLQVHYYGQEPAEYGVRVAYDLPASAESGAAPTWLVPGSFYGENRLEHCHVRYPRYVPEGGDLAQMESPWWSFRADRAAVPAVFGWSGGLCAALATDETSPLGISGVGFSGAASEKAGVWLDFPYREEPLVYVGFGRQEPPDCPLYRWHPGRDVRLTYRLYAAAGAPHAYDAFVRELYALDKPRNPLRPWMGLAQAAELTAHGLHHWHYRAGILNETMAFDREFSGSRGLGDRPNMHVSWVSGIPYAHALLTYGRSAGRADYVEAALAVIDKIASGIAPCGTFWGEWRGERGWTCGWTPNRQWLQARTLAEATLFMIRAVAAERQLGQEHPAWDAAVRSNLDFAAAHQREDGNLGSYYHCETGEVVEWEGAGGILWIAALVEGAMLLDDPRLEACAQKAGEYYSRFVEQELIYGAPEDVHLSPTSEDGYNAVIAYVLLYEADRSDRWLGLARRAAEWTVTFRWTYNLKWPEHTLLQVYDFRSRGADLASPSNQHLHNYGLVCAPEMLRLWQYTGDAYYLERTRDHVACFLQMIARVDGDFNAQKGMVAERFYNTNCFQIKGMVLTLSHAWCIGLILYASQAVAPWAGEMGLDP